MAGGVPGVRALRVRRLGLAIPTANVVANFALSNLRTPVSVRQLPSASGVAPGSGLLPASRSGDGYTYVYGVDDSPINKQMRIARVYGSDLASGTWQYHTPWGWTFQ